MDIANAHNELFETEKPIIMRSITYEKRVKLDKLAESRLENAEISVRSSRANRAAYRSTEWCSPSETWSLVSDE